jgi:RNA polymerase sigma-70 factor (ECF subfamily)
LTVLELVFMRLRDKYLSEGKKALFEHLQGCLPGAQQPLNYRETAKALNMEESAVRNAVLRMRRRYGDTLRAEIAATVNTIKEVDEEIRHLIEISS